MRNIIRGISRFVSAIGRFIRVLFVTTFTIFIIIAALVVTSFFFRIEVATFVLGQLFGIYGFSEARFQIEEISDQRVHIADLSLGTDAPAVKSVSVSYELVDLWRGQVKAIVLDGARIEGNFEQTGGVGGASLDLSWISDQLSRTGATITLNDGLFLFYGTPGGNIAVAVDAQADFSRLPAVVSLTVRSEDHEPSGPLAKFTFNGAGTIEKAGVNIKGPATVTFANGRVGQWNIDRLEYDDVAELHVIGSSARFALSSPIDLSVRQLGEGKGAEVESPLSFDLRTGAAQIVFEWEAGLSGNAEITDGSIEVEAWRLKADNINLQLPFEQRGSSAELKLECLVVDLSEVPRFNPQNFDASLKREGDDLLVDATAVTRDTSAKLDLSGKYSIAEGVGAFEIGPSILNFNLDTLQPVDVSPLLSSFRNTVGKVHVSGNLTVSPTSPPESRARILIDDLETDFSALSFVGLSGTLELEDLFDPISAPGQTFVARDMTAPIPIKDPKLVLHWVRTGTNPVVRIQSAEGQFADGTIGVGSTSIQLSDDRYDLTLLFNGLSLETLFEEWAGGRVSGDGTLSGTVPVTLTQDGPIITEGGLAAENQGFIKVHWGDSRESLTNRGNEVALMVQALDNFQYRELTVGVRRRSNEDLTLQVLLEGSNPDVLNGYPFRINVNLYGDLENVLAAIAEGQSLTQDLLRARLKSGNKE